jgi:hypothetical protein
MHYCNLHQANTLSFKSSTDAGWMISIRSVLINAHFSICHNLDPDSNVTEESALHFEKEFAPKNATESGMATILRSLFSNAFLSIQFNSIRFNFDTSFRWSQLDWWRKPQRVDNETGKANDWNSVNSANNYDCSETELPCDFPENLRDLRLWVCHED